ncbi:unnamed protein product [Durusdinium trenchii]|uniref:Uncharacterized protein n=1 Tax=Durusdinium trenchii TaxID=1381693 RepID=A0ABP0IRP1_9DINO
MELLQGPMPSGKVERSQGSMSHSSKRRLVAPDEFEILEPPFVSEAERSTLVRESEIEDFGKGDVNLKIPVPREVKDGPQWGRTLMQLPALKRRNLSYAEIFDLVVEEDADITKYCRWVMETHGKTVTDAPRTRAEDFAMYLR